MCLLKMLSINVRHSRREDQGSVPEVLLIRVRSFLYSPKTQKHLLM